MKKIVFGLILITIFSCNAKKEDVKSEIIKIVGRFDSNVKVNIKDTLGVTIYEVYDIDSIANSRDINMSLSKYIFYNLRLNSKLNIDYSKFQINIKHKFNNLVYDFAFQNNAHVDFFTQELRDPIFYKTIEICIEELSDYDLAYADLTMPKIKEVFNGFSYEADILSLLFYYSKKCNVQNHKVDFFLSFFYYFSHQPWDEVLSFNRRSIERVMELCNKQDYRKINKKMVSDMYFKHNGEYPFDSITEED
jgi:hypothetical protein